jgi:hypothetical protein
VLSPLLCDPSLDSPLQRQPHVDELLYGWHRLWAIHNQAHRLIFPAMLPKFPYLAIGKSGDAHSSNVHSQVANHAKERLYAKSKTLHWGIADYLALLYPSHHFVQEDAVLTIPKFDQIYRDDGTLFAWRFSPNIPKKRKSLSN